MLSFKRSDRVKELMQKEISEIIQNDLNDPRIGFVTVTRVDLTDNLRSAKVFVSPMGSEDEKKQTIKAITKACGFIRREMGRRMTIKYLPELIFKWDHGQERSEKVNDLLGTVNNEEQGEGTPE